MFDWFDSYKIIRSQVHDVQGQRQGLDRKAKAEDLTLQVKAKELCQRSRNLKRVIEAPRGQGLVPEDSITIIRSSSVLMMMDLCHKKNK